MPKPQKPTSETETSTRSRLEFINAQLKRIAGAWKSFDTKINAPIYLEEIKAMIAELGETRVERGITTAIRRHLEFVPSVAELWEYCRTAGDGRVVKHPDPCNLCHSTGYAPHTWTNKHGQVVSGVRRCPNWSID
jgi:hypothetical protein